jgi:hypothetical protein
MQQAVPETGRHPGMSSTWSSLFWPTLQPMQQSQSSARKDGASAAAAEQTHKSSGALMKIKSEKNPFISSFIQL